MLNSKTSGQLIIAQDDLESHLKKVCSDPRKDEELPAHEKLIEVDPPSIMIDESPPTIREMRGVVKKARAASKPGHNGVPYIVYKRCDGLLVLLWKITKVLWRRRRMAAADMCSEGIYIPKEDNSAKLDQFRTVSLLNVEGKIPFAVMSARISQYWVKNGYIDTSVQKGEIPGVSGC